MAILNNCCCCLSLRTGGIVLGVLALIGSLLMVTFSTISMIGSFHPGLDTELNHTLNAHGLTLEDQQAVVIGVRLWMGFYIALAILSVITSLMLIYGSLSPPTHAQQQCRPFTEYILSLQHRRYFLVPYLVSQGIQCVYMGLYFMYQIYLGVSKEDQEGGLIPGVVGILFTLVIQVYFWVCIYSLYQSYRDERQMQFNQQQQYQQPPYNPQVVYSQVTKA